MSIAARGPIPARKAARTTLQNRVRFIFGVLAALYLALFGKLIFLQLVMHKHYVEQADQIRLRSFTVPAVRGDIVDRNNNPMAISVPVADVIGDPTEIAYPEQAAALIASVLPNGSLTASALQSTIEVAQSEKVASGKPLRYLKLLLTLPYTEASALKALQQSESSAHAQNLANRPDYLTGVTISWRNVRDYPNGTLAAQILGFPSKASNGSFEAKYGVEASRDDELAGKDGLLKTEVDDAQRPIPGTDSEQISAQNGKTLVLTIDMRIQAVVEQALNDSIQEFHAQSGSVVVLDPKTGEILAMASLPSFDPNNAAGSNVANWDDRPVSDLYEPGSTLKTLTLAAVLDKMGLAMADHRVTCTGELRIGNHTIHCAKDPPMFGVHGNENMTDVLRNSCNIGASEYAMMLGAKNLYQYEKAFGLFDRPQCGLNGARVSYLADPAVQPWSKIQLADVSFGQGVSLTALQLASVYATIANNGVRVYPHLILGETPPEKAYQVIKPEVAAKMLTMLHAVVTNGTGTPAQVADYTVGGKTGSAQVASGRHGYGDEYIGSFCGIAPLSNPKLVVLCVINKPAPIHWGARVAAPVVRKILQSALWFLKVPPDAQGIKAYVDPEPPKSSQVASSGAVVKPIKQ